MKAHRTVDDDASEGFVAFVDRNNRVAQLVEGLMPGVRWIEDEETLTYLHRLIRINDSGSGCRNTDVSRCAWPIKP